ncbi:MAG TPA: hypothetical protein DHU96_28160 [Actinobacteria bacterium]|nr:hypothetical protein [Actinomycetota bacterium]
MDALERCYRVLGFEDAAGGDDVFRLRVLAWIIEPVSKLDSLRVLERLGASDRTLKRAPADLCGGGGAAAAVGRLRRARYVLRS